MEVRQFFSHHDHGESKYANRSHYCLLCGSELEEFHDSTDQRLKCSNCSWVYYRNPPPGAVVLVAAADKVLLGKRSKSVFGGGKWCLPGGFIEFDEDFLSTGIREFKEETGLTIEILSILSVVTNYLSPDLHTLVIVLQGETIGGEPAPGDDIVELGWFPLAGPLPEMAFEADRHIIERFWKTDLKGLPVDPTYARPRKS